MEKLADGLQKLGEEDLLQVVHIVHENKTSEMYTKNDVESELFPPALTPQPIRPATLPRPRRYIGFANAVPDGEFHMDLYTLPDALIRQLWDFTASRTDM